MKRIYVILVVLTLTLALAAGCAVAPDLAGVVVDTALDAAVDSANSKVETARSELITEMQDGYAQLVEGFNAEADILQQLIDNGIEFDQKYIDDFNAASDEIAAIGEIDTATLTNDELVDLSDTIVAYMEAVAADLEALVKLLSE